MVLEVEGGKRISWLIVLSTRYDEEGCTIGDGGRVASVRWKNFISIRGGAGVGVGLKTIYGAR